MLKPRCLYHGTPQRNLRELSPSDGGELYATDDIRLAVTFLARPQHFGCLKWKGRVHACIAEESAEFLKRDRGGTIYLVDSADFTPRPCGLAEGAWEWTTNRNISPLASIHYESAFAGMIGHGVEVYFVDMDTFRKMEMMENSSSVFRMLKSERQTFFEAFRRRPPDGATAGPIRD